jgi:hypothetical protein
MLDGHQPATRRAADVRWLIVTHEITAIARPLERRIATPCAARSRR